MSIMPESIEASDIYGQLSMLNNLSDQQLAQMSQNPTLGWMAGIIANQRAEARTPTPPTPQGTVIGNKLAQLQQQQGGLPAGMPNQQAMMQADPMTRGIAAAPENAPGAATGGLIALAQGGPVRGFNGEEDSWVNLIPHTESGTNIYEPKDFSESGLGGKYGFHRLAGATADLAGNAFDYLLDANQRAGSKIYHTVTEDVPERWGKRFAKAEEVQKGRESYDPEEQRIIDLPEEYAKKIAAGEPLNKREKVDEETGIKKTLKAEPTKEQKEGVKGAAPAAQKVAAKGPGLPAATPPAGATPPATPPTGTGIPGARTDLYRTINDPNTSAEKSITAIQEALGVPYAMSAELKGQIEKEQAASAEGRMVRSVLGGLGAALATPTEHASRAIGTGLVAGVNQFQQEQDPEKLRNLMLQQAMTEEQAPSAYRHEAGLEYLKQRAAQGAKTEEHQFQMLKQSMGDRARLLAAQIKASGSATTPQELEDKLVEKLTGIYGVTLSPTEIRNTARQLALSGGGVGGAAGSPAPIGRLTSNGLQFFNQPG